MKRSKLALISAVVKSRVQAVLGWTLLAFSVVGFSVELSADELDAIGLTVASLFLAVGVALLACSFRTRRLVNQFRYYVSILSDQSTMSIYQLSVTLGQPEEKVVRALQAMIARHFFASAYVDRGRKCLVFPLLEKARRESQEELEHLPHEIVTCPVCGGDNRIPVGRGCNCMYCDNLLRSESFEDRFHS